MIKESLVKALKEKMGEKEAEEFVNKWFKSNPFLLSLDAALESFKQSE